MTDFPQAQQPPTPPTPPAPLPRARRTGLAAEFVAYLRANKKWWLIPIVVMIVVFGLLFLLVTLYPTLAPFIYATF